MGLGRVIVQCSRNTTQQELSERSSVCWWPKTSSSSRNWNSLRIPFQYMIFSQILQRSRFHSNLWKKKKKKMDPWREKKKPMYFARRNARNATRSSPHRNGRAGRKPGGRRETRVPGSPDAGWPEGKGPSDVSWGNPIRNHASRFAASREVPRIWAVNYYSCQLSRTNEIAAIFARSRCSGENG